MLHGFICVDFKKQVNEAVLLEVKRRIAPGVQVAEGGRRGLQVGSQVLYSDQALVTELFSVCETPRRRPLSLCIFPRVHYAAVGGLFFQREGPGHQKTLGLRLESIPWQTTLSSAPLLPACKTKEAHSVSAKRAIKMLKKETVLCMSRCPMETSSEARGSQHPPKGIKMKETLY